MGADDGLVSTACLMIGVAASSAAMNAILLAGVAGLVAGALSMAAGEYVSVSSLRDVEDANIAQEKKELATNSKGELRELAVIYEKRGLKPDLARQVAEQLSEHNVS
jgi:VIT1/CCC1 family predicted Fe2+/Mn2+ transporter